MKRENRDRFLQLPEIAHDAMILRHASGLVHSGEISFRPYSSRLCLRVDWIYVLAIPLHIEDRSDRQVKVRPSSGAADVTSMALE